MGTTTFLALLAGVCVVVAVVGCGTPRRDPPATVVVSTGVPALPDFARPSDLYRGTPAEAFPIGEAALASPPTPAVAGVPPAQVSDALARVRTVLVASYLHDRMLVAHDPGEVLSLLAPAARDEVAAEIARGELGTVFVRFVDGARLASPPRLDGGVTASLSRLDNGVHVLDVRSDYVVAYAFEHADALVLVRSQVHWLFPFPDEVDAPFAGMLVGDSAGFWSGMDCAASARGLTGPGTGVDPRAKPLVVDTRSPESYYDPTSPVTVPSGCLNPPPTR